MIPQTLNSVTSTLIRVYALAADIEAMLIWQHE